MALADLDERDASEGSATTVNGQHDLDIIVGTRASGIANIRVWWNGQPGAYTGNVYYRATESYLGNASYDIPALAASDIDNSGATTRDLISGAVTGTNVGLFQVWRNQAYGGAGEVQGRVGAATSPVTPNAQYYDNPGTGEARAVAIDDLNGDGRKDVVVGTKTNTNQGKVEVWWGDGAGGFTHSISLDVYTATGEVRSIAVSDMNADGFPDIVTGTKTNNADTQGNLDIFYSNGLSTRRFTTVYSVAVGGAIYAIGAARMDDDSYTDIITAVKSGSNAGKIEFWKNNGTIVGALTRRDEQATPGPALSLALGQLDYGNTSIDIAVGTAGAGGSTPPAVEAFFCDPAASGGAIIPNVLSWSDANAGGAVNALAIGRLECSQDRLGDDALSDIVAGTATSASTGDLVIYLNPYSSTVYP
jgi:hypothetical protein